MFGVKDKKPSKKPALKQILSPAFTLASCLAYS
jgi:hypothetical protein